MRYIIGLIVLVGGLVGGAFAVRSILWQHRAVTAFVETPATILSSQLTFARHKNSSSYFPTIRYEYLVNGTRFESEQVHPFNNGSSSRAWAQEILDRYPPAPAAPEDGGPRPANAVAYVDPQNPAHSVLIRAYFFFPYSIAMLACFVALCGVGIMVTDAFTFNRQHMVAVALDDSGGKLLLPTQNLRRRFRNALVWLVGLGLIATVLPGHWLLTTGQLGTGLIVFTSIFAALFMVVAVATFLRWNVSRHTSDARLRVRPAPFPRGTPCSMELEVDAYSPLNVEAATATVVCQHFYQQKQGNKVMVGSRILHQAETRLSCPEHVAAGQILAASGELGVPVQLPPTSERAGKEFPYYVYEIRVRLKLKGMLDYAATFPLQVI